MAEEKFVAAGIDISDDVTLAAFFTAGMDDPQMVGDKTNENDFLIPTAIEKNRDGWVVGKECNKPVSNLFSKARYGIKHVIEDYDAIKLLAIFSEKLVRYVMQQSGEDKIDVVTFAFPRTDKAIIDVIRKHFVENGLGGIRLIFITHAESCIYYVLNQKKELRINDVAFFDFSKERLLFRKLHMIRQGNKPIMDISEIDCTSRCNYIGKTDDIFKSLVTELFEKQQITTVYLIGEGFANEAWARESLNYICSRRRVFKGRNLYAVGACYKSLDGYDKYSYDSYCILAKGRTRFETCMEVVFKETHNEAIILGAGELWYDAGISVEGILNNTDKINFVIRTVTGEVVKHEEFVLEEFPRRQERMTRVKVEGNMQNENEICITISDLGFGEYAVSSGLQVVKNIQY